MKPFLPLFPYIQATYLANNYDTCVCNICPCNSGAMADHRCKSCYLHPPTCSSCIVAAHRHLPFHRIKQWNGRYFQRTSLRNLGFVFCLGHSGDPCPNQLPNTIRKLTVVDVNGYHEANFKFCFCRDAELDEAKQLFCHLLFPATIKHPKTVFTMEVLDNFDVHHSTFMKSAESFCVALQKMSAPELPDEVSVCAFSNRKIISDMISFRIHIVPLCKRPTSIVTYRLFAAVDKPITLMTLLHIARKTVSLCIVQHVPSQDGISILKCYKRLTRVKGKSHHTRLQLFLMVGQTQIHTFLGLQWDLQCSLYSQAWQPSWGSPSCWPCICGWRTQVPEIPISHWEWSPRCLSHCCPCVLIIKGFYFYRNVTVQSFMHSSLSTYWNLSTLLSWGLSAFNVYNIHSSSQMRLSTCMQGSSMNFASLTGVILWEYQIVLCQSQSLWNSEGPSKAALDTPQLQPCLPIFAQFIDTDDGRAFSWADGQASS